jgi:hypothetical protein
LDHPGDGGGAIVPAPVLDAGETVRVAAGLSMPLGSEEVSQAVELGDCNSVRVELVIVNDGVTLPMVVHVEASLNREGWRRASQTSLTGAGHKTWRLLGLTDRYVRLRYRVPLFGSAAKIVSAYFSGVRAAGSAAGLYGAIA